MHSISTEKAPAAIGPYSQGVVVNGLLFASGQIALSPETGELVGSTIEEQAEQVMKNVGALLTAAGTDFDHVVKTTCFLEDIADFAKRRRENQLIRVVRALGVVRVFAQGACYPA